MVTIKMYVFPCQEWIALNSLFESKESNFLNAEYNTEAEKKPHKPNQNKMMKGLSSFKSLMEFSQKI